MFVVGILSSQFLTTSHVHVVLKFPSGTASLLQYCIYSRISCSITEKAILIASIALSWSTSFDADGLHSHFTHLVEGWEVRSPVVSLLLFLVEYLRLDPSWSLFAHSVHWIHWSYSADLPSGNIASPRVSSEQYHEWLP